MWESINDIFEETGEYEDDLNYSYYEDYETESE